MQDAFDSGIPIASAHSKKIGDKIKSFKEKRIEMLAPPNDTRAAQIPCVHDPAKECSLCEMFDECPYPDRQSSLMSVSLALIMTVLLVAGAVGWFLIR